MTVEELLAGLNDIQLPVEPGWWPLALGWWYLLCFIGFILITLWFLAKRKRANQPVIIATNELEKIKNDYLQSNNDKQLASNLSIWLKKVCLYAFPDKSVAGLTGRGWVEFLDNNSNNNEFTNGAGKVFADSIYSNDVKINAAAVIELCEKWLASVKPELIKQGQG